MSVLIIRSHKRFAVRRSVTLRGEAGELPGGLMIELSSEGCRISNASSATLAADQEITVELGDGASFSGRVRWAHDGFVGVRFDRALRQVELATLLEHSRAPEYRAAVA